MIGEDLNVLEAEHARFAQLAVFLPD
jgi:hypothetical protein